MAIEQTKYSLTIDGVRSVVSGLTEVEGGFGKVSNKISGVIGSVSALSAAGGALSIGAFAAMIKSSIDAADNLNDLSKSTGITVENLSGLNLLAEQSGSSLEGLGKAINKMSENMGREAASFAKIGITAKDPIEAFKQVADVFNSIEDPQTRAAFGAKVFGKQWEGIASVLSEGSRSIGEAIEKGKALSGVTQDAADQADQFNDQLAEMKVAAHGLSLGLAKEMMPAMNSIIGAVKTAYEDSGKLQALWVAMGGLGAFLFTDEFSSATVKIKNLEGDIASLEQNKKNLVGGGYLQQWLFGTSSEIDAKIAAAKAQIESLKKAMQPQEKPKEEPKKSPDGLDKFIGLKPEQQKAYDDAIKKSEDFIAQIKKEAAAVGATTEQQKMYEAEQIAGQLRLAGVRDDVLLKFLNGSLREAEALDKLQQQHKLAEEIKAQNIKSIEDLNKLGTETVHQLEDELVKLREHNDQIGMTTESIGALTAARYEQAAAADEESAANLRAAADYAGPLHDAYLQYAADLEKSAKLKRELATGTREGTVKEAIVDQQKKAADEAKKIWDNFTENVQHNLGDGLYNAMNGTFDGIGAAFRSMVQHMVADALAAKVTQALFGGMAGGSGGLGVLGSILGAGISMFGGGTTAAAGLASALPGDALDNFLSIYPGKASGGKVFPGSLQPVNERGPELLTSGGKDYLMMGAEGGTVTPNDKLGGNAVHLTYAPVTHVDSRTDQRDVEAMIERGNQRGHAQMLDQLRRARLI